MMSTQQQRGGRTWSDARGCGGQERAWSRTDLSLPGERPEDTYPPPTRWEKFWEWVGGTGIPDFIRFELGKPPF